MSEFISIKEGVELTGKSEATIRRIVKGAKSVDVTIEQTNGGQEKYLFRKSLLEKYFEKNTPSKSKKVSFENEKDEPINGSQYILKKQESLYNKTIERLERDIDKKNIEIKEKDNSLKEKEEVIKEKELVIASYIDRTQKLQNELLLLSDGKKEPTRAAKKSTWWWQLPVMILSVLTILFLAYFIGFNLLK